MKQAIKLAYRNLIGAGLRTWLNVSVLSFSFVVILFYNGLIDGWNKQARRDTIEWETGNGHLTHHLFDPFDPYTILDGHASINDLDVSDLNPVLVRQASIYPEGRMLTVALKGIKPNQSALKLPTQMLDTNCTEIPLLIGQNMARSSGLRKGDIALLQWKDKNGTLDAADAIIVDVFKTTVPTIDGGQLYTSINRLWEITNLKNEATFLIANKDYNGSGNIENWVFKTQDELLATLDKVIATEKASGSIFYILLMLIALLAIFDTQVLSIFRRQKEIGTYMALGMTKSQVVKLFTIEGLMYSILAMIVGCTWGIPILNYFANNGIPYPIDNMDDFGISISSIMYPIYSLKLILGTVIAVVISATIVSYLPARKITKMNAVDALKGKLQ